MKRDFTYIDDIVEGVVRVLDRIAAGNPQWNGKQPDPASSRAPWRVYNIGNHSPVELMHFIEVLEEVMGMKAVKRMLPMQPGDVPSTMADVQSLTRLTGFAPTTGIEIGLARFWEWYRSYYVQPGGR